jgi:nicotinamidase-related amidase
MRSPKLFTREQSALVVVDVQQSFLDPVYEKERVVERSQFLIRCANVLGVPILATVQYAERMGGTIAAISELLPSSCPTTDKLCFSCFGAEEFARNLQTTGRKQVILCGIETHICVNQTAHDLLHAGYTVGIPFDAVSSRDKKNHKNALRRMEAAGAIIANTESVVYEWMYESGSAEFKDILKIVKG